MVHDVLAAIAPGWRRRVRGFRRFGDHLYDFTARVSAHLFAIDRERGRLRDDDPSWQRSTRRFARRESFFYAPRVARIFLPRYSPHPRPVQAPTQRVLDAYPE